MPAILKAESAEREYFLLPNERDEEASLPPRRSPPRRRHFFNLLFVCSVVFNAVFIVNFLGYGAPPNSRYVLWKGDTPVWTPAGDVIPYKNQKAATFLQRSKYSGPPTTEVDRAWKDLYLRYVMSAIPEEEAQKLSNETMRVPGPGHPRYVVGLDVFHQLHCLDYIREHLYPEYYGHGHKHEGLIAPPEGPDDLPFDHLDHCINNVRQALMCNADLTPNVAQWHAPTHRSWGRLDVVHTCRDWDAVHQWVVDHHIGVKLNWTEHVGFPEDNNPSEVFV